MAAQARSEAGDSSNDEHTAGASKAKRLKDRQSGLCLLDVPLAVFAQIPDTSGATDQDRARWADLTELMDIVVGRNLRDRPDEESLLGLAEDLVDFAQKRGPSEELEKLYTSLGERLGPFHNESATFAYDGAAAESAAHVAEVLTMLAHRRQDFGTEFRAYEVFRRDLLEAFGVVLHNSRVRRIGQLATGRAPLV